MPNNTPTTTERAREFIDDVLAINAMYGMRSVTSEGAYEAAVAKAARKAERLERAIARSASRPPISNSSGLADG